jgi:hypothetical protein
LTLGCGFALWVFRSGATLFYGDAAAHLAIARRIVDSQTPGFEQTGTVWLPLLHWLMIPFVRCDAWWFSGLAGVFVPVMSFVLAGLFLHAAAGRALGHPLAGVAAALAFALNPNVLYLQSIPMTETLFLACLTGLAAALVWFQQTGATAAVLLAGLAALAGSLTRYEGWFILPVAALAILATGGKRRWRAAILFGVIAGAGPLFWLGYNHWFYSNWLEFYNGPYSAKAIQGAADYPGRGDWPGAWRYYAAAARECAGLGLLLAASLGFLGVLARRAWIPLLLFAAVPAFYIWSVHSGSTPVQVPSLWPGSFYNSRYGMAVMPLAAFCAAGAVALLPRGKAVAAIAVAAASLAPWVFYPRTSNWVTYQESTVNSKARREWTARTAEYLRLESRPGDEFYTSFGDLTSVFREARIPLRRTLHEGNGLTWYAANTRPDLFFWQRWAVLREGDATARELKRRGLSPVRVIPVESAPAIEIYRNEHPFSQGARR